MAEVSPLTHTPPKPVCQAPPRCPKTHITTMARTCTGTAKGKQPAANRKDQKEAAVTQPAANAAVQAGKSAGFKSLVMSAWDDAAPESPGTSSSQLSGGAAVQLAAMTKIMAAITAAAAVVLAVPMQLAAMTKIVAAITVAAAVVLTVPMQLAAVMAVAGNGQPVARRSGAQQARRECGRCRRRARPRKLTNRSCKLRKCG